MANTHESINREELRKIPAILETRRITCELVRIENRIENIIRYFENEVAATAITCEAGIELEEHTYDGFITIHRDGRLEVRLKR